MRALQRIIPRARVDDALAQTGRDRTHCRRLPGWFMVWFMIALGLFSRDAYRQIFRWLQVFRPGGIPGRSTLCEARQRLGVAPCARWPHRSSRCWVAPRRPAPSTAACAPWPSMASC
ncbi:transposase domain-containing protein [Lamprobacter modestohalophilus]|uniref:transposase domain-containing protein n=1 Tax=Lamprobacter modestohalophilus TaxID=1064514 RepID=UPI003D18F6C9